MRRSVAAAFGTQLVTAAGLLALDSIRRRDRPDREFPRAPARALPVPGGEVRVYTYGEDLFEDMLADIDSATERVFFESYIWKGDEVGARFRDALVAAHERGVEVYVVFDEFANLVVPRSFYASLPDGIHVLRHPLVSGGPAFFMPHNWGRNHRKLLVVDDEAAYVGGYNIGGLYATKWRDTHARFAGEIVVELENAFVDYWNEQGGTPLLPQPRRRTWSRTTRVHRNVPVDYVYPIRNMYLEAIDMASERVWLTHAYFLPDRDMVSALQDATKRGVDVRIILPAKSNHVVVDWLSRGFYEELLSAGVRLFGYRNAMVHAKTAVIDGTWSTIGTANLDRLSLAGNYEVNLEIVDEDVGELMEQIFTRDLTNTFEFTEERWAKRSLTTKATEKLLSPWRPMF